MVSPGMTAETDPAFLVGSVAECMDVVLPTSSHPSPRPGDGRLPVLPAEEARSFMADVQDPWTAFFAAGASACPPQPVIMARRGFLEPAGLPV